MKQTNFFLYFFLLLLPVLFFNDASFLYFDYFSLFVFFIFVFYLVRFDKNFAVLSFYTFFVFISTLLTTLIIEHGTYLIEIDEISYPLGVTSKGALTSFLFLSGMYISYIFFKRTNLGVKNLSVSSQIATFYGVRILITVMCIAMIMLLMKYGIPLLMGIHRADFWSGYAPSWGGTLAFWLIQVSFLLGFIYSKTKSRIDILLFIFLLFVTILSGSRFTGIMQTLVYFFIPILVLSKSFKIHNPKFVISFSVVFILLLAVVFNSFEAKSSQERQNNLALRIVLQGQMWWALDRKSTIYPKESDEILNSYIGLSKDPREKSYNYLMYLVAPTAFVNQKLETDSRFTMSGFFNNYYFFGYFVGGFINFISAIFFGFLVFLLYLTICSNNVILLFFVFKLFTKVEAILYTGNVDDFFSLNFLVFTIGIILFLTLVKNKSVNYDK